MTVDIHSASRHAEAAEAAPFRPELAAEFAALLSALRTAAERLAALLEEQTTERARWLSTAQAAELALIGSTQSVRNWARKYGLGLKVGNHWQIDRRLLEEFLRDRDHGARPPQGKQQSRPLR